jgi:hypothetical protein
VEYIWKNIIIKPKRIENPAAKNTSCCSIKNILKNKIEASSLHLAFLIMKKNGDNRRINSETNGNHPKYFE